MFYLLWLRIGLLCFDDVISARGGIGLGDLDESNLVSGGAGRGGGGDFEGVRASGERFSKLRDGFAELHRILLEDIGRGSGDVRSTALLDFEDEIVGF